MLDHRNKILFIITDFGGFNNFLSELSYHLVVEKNIEIVVICSREKIIDIDDKYNYSKSGIRFCFVDIPRGYNIIKSIIAGVKIRSILNREKPNLVLAHFTASIFATILFTNRKNQKIWGTFHGLGFVAHKGVKRLFIKSIEMFCVSRLEQTIVITKKDFKSIPTKYLPKARLITSLGLGCDLSKFNLKRFDASEKVHLRRVLGINDEFVLAFIGRFVNFKGFHIVVEVFSKISSSNPGKYKLLLVGDEDRLHPMGLTKRAVTAYNSHPDIIKTGFTSQVEKYLALTDLLVFPSKKEGVPIAVTESLAMGVPVLAFDSRGSSDLIRNGFNGVLLDENIDFEQAVSEFQREIEKMFNDRAYYSKLKCNTLLERDLLSRTHFVQEQTEWYIKEMTKG